MAEQHPTRRRTRHLQPGIRESEIPLRSRLVTATGLTARLNLAAPFTFETIEPLGYASPSGLRTDPLSLVRAVCRVAILSAATSSSPVAAMRDETGQRITATLRHPARAERHGPLRCCERDGRIHLGRILQDLRIAALLSTRPGLISGSIRTRVLLSRRAATPAVLPHDQRDVPAASHGHRGYATGSAGYAGRDTHEPGAQDVHHLDTGCAGQDHHPAVAQAGVSRIPA